MDDRSATPTNRPRIVVYTVNPLAYRLLRSWSERHEYEFALVVTSPGPKRARSTGYREIIAESPPQQDILVTTAMGRTAPLVAAVKPDLILSFSLPFRLPPEVTAIPLHGAVNMHPAPLPAYRGPNPARMIYNGEPILGATLHRTAADYDTGAILSQHTRPMPNELTPDSILSVWGDLILRALDDGVPRALADEPGTPQDDAQASYAASFTEKDMWLDWGLPAATLQRQTVALNIFEPQARGMIEGRSYAITDLREVPDPPGRLAPGTVLAWSGNTATIQTGQGLAQVKTAVPGPGIQV